ncbi:MAG: DNA polymerase I [Bacteroidetes bacterium RIFOXYA12_FULL_35_11]|nr:MAG: DNA polymerase I [Bacteroidetes bacterium GWF2_35_48]OFY77888.1 MAG: DNA polymerase I [Bacteroidetes bacterium RIFOXYA12_FULL_35_11]OFY96034.1 MAG: DNA polymerase I [Bacteroidetes bacterium RIFOXYC12_FULL_35_7]HBX50360.1 DNA polymerase I [Bacteroidales bacterium]
MEKKLFLLDAYALIYRSYYAFIRNPRFNSKGLNTSAIFGFVNTLEDILKTQSPTHIAVAFDLSAPTFRHEFYPAYKANREETPEDIRKSVPIIKEILKAYNIALLEAPGYEADDVIGTLAKKAEKNGFITYMMTPDKDYGQLVSDTIFMYKPRRGEGDVEILGKNEICKNFSLIDPMQFIDILALWGDVSDNVPGAPGIGEKTAIKLISEFGNIDNIYANIDKLKGKQRESLEQNKEQVYRAKKLVTIAIDAPVELDEQILMLHKPDNQKLKTIFEELEFRTMAQRLIVQPADPALAMVEETPVQPEQKQQYSIPQQGMLNLFGDEQLPTVTTAQKSFKTIQDVEHNYHLITDKEKRSELISKLSSLNEFCFDTETTGLEAIDTEIVGLSFSYKTGEAFYVPIPINREEAQSLINEFKLVFENTEIKKIGQNIKYDMLMLKAYDIDVKGEIFDTMLAHYLLQPELRHNMNFLAESYLNYSPVPIENLIGKKGKNQMSMRSVALEQISEYAGEDADITWQLKEIFEKELEKNNLSALAQKVEMPLARVLADMEFTGVSLNTKALNIFAQQLVEEIMQIEKEIYTLSGMEFNISSPQQLGKVLFDHLKISSDAKKTKTDQYSTGEEVLEKIVDAHPVIPKILEFRSLKKLHSTYVEALPKLIHKKTGKIHTSYNQALVSTGRLSSNNPNLQNIPIREERGREIRKAFIPSTAEHVFLSADYSQVELRIMAHLSQDTAMIDAFIHDEDIHAATAAKIFNIPLTEVTSDMRRKAKTANFGIIYGISSFGLAQRLSISRSEAKQLIDGYFLTYPKVKKYMDQSIFIAREKGYVETILGRRRFLPDINSKNAIVRGVAERNAINAPIQGSAADIIKIAMINIFSQFEKENLKSKMIMQVHDELNFDVLKSELDVVKNIVRNEMQQAIQLSVPLTVDIGVGENWLEAH